ncbi:MAG: hypothetical protein OEX19_07810 [Gammaproteobacteria bacterium]|nr:hypothetical protein [Gammaproteobacteria bacterium]
MNISHNYSGLSDDKNLHGGVSEMQLFSDLTPHCLDEEALRELINIPSTLFHSRPESSD